MSTRSPRRGNVTRAAVALLLLVLVVGLIAYVAQNLKRWQTPAVPQPRPVAEKPTPLLEFTNTITNGAETRVLAIWEKVKPGAKEDQAYLYKELEAGKPGHYDFLFRSVVNRNVEVGLRTSSCDCASVQACVVSEAEWTQLRQLQAENPGEPLQVTVKDEDWHNLFADPKKKPLSLKPEEYGIIRVKWDARKPAGQELKLFPVVWAEPAGKPGERQEYPFVIPGVVTHSVRVFPPSVHIGELPPGATGKAEFEIWSSTLPKLDLPLTIPNPDTLFVVKATELTPAERVGLAARLNADKEFLRVNKFPTRVLCGYHVTVTVHESRDGKQLEQGGIFRKLPIILDGSPNPHLPGPEIVGRVLGDIEIGGANDQGKIRFKSFDSSVGATTVVYLSADPKVTLAPFEKRPTSLQVDLKRDLKNSTPERSFWELKVTLPSESLFSGSFTPADAVTLRVVGDPPRFVRIPLEGNVGGRRTTEPRP